MAANLADATPVSISTSDETGANKAGPKRYAELNLPLYISALIGLLAAFFSVNSVVGSDTIGWWSIGLAILGTGFAMQYRRAGYPSLPLNIGVSVIVLTFGISVAAHWINVDAILPYGSVQSDLVLALIIQCLSAVYTFTMIDDKRILMSSIISMAMIGLVSTYNVNGDLIISFLVYMVATIFLLLHQSFLMFRPWGAVGLSRQKTNYLLLIQLACSIGGAVISLGVGTLLVIPLEAIGSHLSLVNALKSLANLAPNSAAADAVQSVAAQVDEDTSTFAVGQGPTSTGDDRTILMLVNPDDGVPHYLRGRTYDRYTGSGWESTLKTSFIGPSSGSLDMMGNITWLNFKSDPADAGVDSNHVRPEVTLNIQVTNYTSSTMYMPANVDSIGLPYPQRAALKLYQDGLVALPGPAFRIQFIAKCRPEDVSPEDLMRDNRKDFPPRVQDMYVNQRGDAVNADDKMKLTRTVASIVNALPANHRNEFDKAHAIEKWVSQQAKYSLDVDPVPDGKDAVTYFLFQSREGYCDLFASSMVLLCRYAGIPARVATGFDGGRLIRWNTYSLTSADKHAWVEVYFPGYGWQTFDPTIGTVLAPPHVRQNSMLAWIESEISFLLKQSGPQPLIPRVLAVIVLLTLILIIMNEVLSRFFARKNKGRSKSQNDDNGGLSSLNRASLARLAAIDRWRLVGKYARKWRPKQDDYETCIEFTRSLTTAITNASRVDSSETGQHYDGMFVSEAVRRLSREYISAKYSASDYFDQDLVTRHENHSASHDLDTLILAASNLPRRRKSDEQQFVSSFVYSQKQLAQDPLDSPDLVAK